MNKKELLKLEIEKLKLQIELKKIELRNEISINSNLNIKSNQIKK